MGYISLAIFFVFFFVVPEFWLIAWSRRMFKKKGVFPSVLGLIFASGALLWPVVLFGGMGSLLSGITATR